MSRQVLGLVGHFVRGVSYNPASDLRVRPTQHTVQLLRSNNVQDGRIELVDVQHVDRQRVRPDQHLIHGDVLICAANGSKRLVGKAAQVLEPRGLTFGAFMMVFRPDASKVLPAYIAHHFHSKSYRDWVEVLLAGSSINNLRSADLAAFSVWIPESPEQRAVAAAIGDADDLIATLERMIAKKQAIKQGMMQQLLTGKTRLPGFTEPWGEQASFEDLCTRSTGFWGASDSSASSPNRVRVITAGDITPEGHLTGAATRYFSNAQVAKARCMADDLVVTSSGNGLGKTAYIDEPGTLAASNFVRILRPRRGVLGSFLAQVMRTPAARGVLDSNTATSAYPNLLPGFFTERWIPRPPSDEQLAIAGVLQDADAEITALRARLNKARAVKTGMMQELLTGRTRLPIKEDAR